MTRQPPLRRPADDDLDIDIRVLTTRELDAAADILADGMRDNPLHLKAFGADAKHRRRRLRQFLDHLVSHVHAGGTLFGAFAHDELVGVLGMMKPGRCRPAPMAALRLAGVVVASNPPLGVWRIGRWLVVWARNDPAEPHWHIGPLAVRAEHRRRGIARRLMTQCCQRIDALSASAWLETDLAINVAFYETLGFVVVAKQPVLGVPNWFMHRKGVDKGVGDHSGARSRGRPLGKGARPGAGHNLAKSVHDTFSWKQVFVADSWKGRARHPDLHDAILVQVLAQGLHAGLETRPFCRVALRRILRSLVFHGPQRIALVAISGAPTAGIRKRISHCAMLVFVERSQ